MLMPIIEYKCPLQHVTEHIVLSRANADRAPHKVRCSHSAQATGRGGFQHPAQCSFLASRVEISTTGAPILKEGVGGFHKPSR